MFTFKGHFQIITIITLGQRLHTLICCCCYCSITKPCLTICDLMDCSMPGSSVLHSLPEFAQICVHWVSGAYLTISSCVAPFSFCLQSFPVSGSFPMSCFFTSGGQSIGASASVLQINIQHWFLLGLTDWISL